MTQTITLAASGTYIIDPSTARISGIYITNSGSGTVYFGHIPGAAVVREGAAVVNGSAVVTLANASEALALEQGMAVTGTGIGAGAVVKNINGAQVTLSVNSTSNTTSTLTFTPPAISTTNGHPIPPGSNINFDATNWSLQNGLSLIADGTGSTLVISIKRH